MNRRPGLAVGLRLVLAVVLTGLAVLVGVHRPAADVVSAAPAQLVPLTSDQQVLTASAALDRIVEVTRDPDGRLVMVLPADVDPLTLGQENPAPPDYPPRLGLGARGGRCPRGAGGAPAAPASRCGSAGRVGRRRRAAGRREPRPDTVVGGGRRRPRRAHPRTAAPPTGSTRRGSR